MATYNLFLNASQADAAITKAYRLFDQNGLTGQSISLYGGNINNRGTISSTQLYITGGVGQESFINRLTGGIRVAGDSEFDRILNGVDILGTSYIQTLTGGLNVTNGGANIVGNTVNNGSFRNVGSVSVTGPTAITGATRIVGNTDIRGNFYQSGVFDVISTDAEFRGNVDVTGTLDVYGPLRVFGRTTIESTGGLTVSGPSTVIGNSTLQGITNIVGELQLNGEPFITQQINEVTEVNYFLTGGECVSLLSGLLTGAGGVIQTSNTGLVARNQGPITTGTTRGAYSVDLQLSRNSIVSVAAGNHSVLVGGNRNKSVGPASVVIGGTGNWALEDSSAIIGGTGNWTFGYYSNIFGGQKNYISNQGSNTSILGGAVNAALGASSVVLGGYKNQAHKTHSVAFGTRAKTYNQTELVQGSYYGQRGWLMGGYNTIANQNELSSAFLWGDTNYIAPDSGIFIPSGTTFIKFRICKEEIMPTTTSEPTTSGPTTTVAPTTTTAGPTTTVAPTTTTAGPTTTVAPTTTTAGPTTTVAPTTTTAGPTTTEAPRYSFEGNLCPSQGGNGVTIWLETSEFNSNSIAYVNSSGPTTYTGYFVTITNTYVYMDGVATVNSC